VRALALLSPFQVLSNINESGDYNVSKVQKPKIIAGEAALLARRYVKALLELADEKKVVDLVAGDLEAMQEVIENDTSFTSMAKNPRLSIKDVTKVIDQMIAKASFNDLTAAFLRQIVKARRLSLLNIIIHVFQDELAKRRGEYTAFVTSSKALSKDQEIELAKQLGSIMNGSVKLLVEEDDSLMGGLVIKMGSRLIDASIKGKLARLERQLKMQQEAA